MNTRPAFYSNRVAGEDARAPDSPASFSPELRTFAYPATKPITANDYAFVFDGWGACLSPVYNQNATVGRGTEKVIERR
jgi:hypothetical protein